MDELEAVFALVAIKDPGTARPMTTTINRGHIIGPQLIER
jgi:hypothetical protein